VLRAQAARPEDPLLQPAQFGPPGPPPFVPPGPPPHHRRRRRRCWTEHRRVMVRGHDGRLHPRTVPRRVCR